MGWGPLRRAPPAPCPGYGAPRRCGGMFQYVVRRLVYGIITLIALSVITFWLMNSTKGDALDRLKSNPRITAEEIRRQTEFYGLDKPKTQQYMPWAKTS